MCLGTVFLRLSHGFRLPHSGDCRPGFFLFAFFFDKSTAVFFHEGFFALRGPLSSPPRRAVFQWAPPFVGAPLPLPQGSASVLKIVKNKLAPPPPPKRFAQGIRLLLLLLFPSLFVFLPNVSCCLPSSIERGFYCIPLSNSSGTPLVSLPRWVLSVWTLRGKRASRPGNLAFEFAIFCGCTLSWGASAEGFF